MLYVHLCHCTTTGSLSTNQHHMQPDGPTSPGWGDNVTPLRAHHSEHTTQSTPLRAHHSEHTTQSTPLRAHHSEHTTHTQQEKELVPHPNLLIRANNLFPIPAHRPPHNWLTAIGTEAVGIDEDTGTPDENEEGRLEMGSDITCLMPPRSLLPSATSQSDSLRCFMGAVFWLFDSLSSICIITCSFSESELVLIWKRNKYTTTVQPEKHIFQTLLG